MFNWKQWWQPKVVLINGLEQIQSIRFFYLHYVSLDESVSLTPKGQTDLNDTRASLFVHSALSKHWVSAHNMKKSLCISAYRGGMSALSCIWNQLAQTATVNQTGQGETPRGERESESGEIYRNWDEGEAGGEVGMVGGGCSQRGSYITFFYPSISCPWSACFSLSWIQSPAPLPRL